MFGIYRKPKGARTDKLKCCATNCFESTRIGVEYEASDQRGGIHGTIYRQYFTTGLPIDLTSGNNVSGLLAHKMRVTDAINRYLFSDWGDRGTACAGIYLTGASGYGNLVISSAVFTIIDGWVEYTK